MRVPRFVTGASGAEPFQRALDPDDHQSRGRAELWSGNNGGGCTVATKDFNPTRNLTKQPARLATSHGTIP
jgi:hypothetical protein